MARLVFRNGPYAGKSLQIPANKTITIGRNRDIELPLPDLKLSRQHCQLKTSADGHLIVIDLESTNGTFVNGERLSGQVELSNFDRLLIGDTEMEYQAPEAIDEMQTRVGMPAPEKQASADDQAKISEALEPLTSATGVDVSAPQPIATDLPDLPDFSADPPQPVQDMTGLTGPTQANEDAVPMDPAEALAELSKSGGAQPVALAELPADDPLVMALAELDRPLPANAAPPPEPANFSDDRPQILFCDMCDASIPILDLDLGEAKELSGKLVCKECLAKGVNIGPGVPGHESGDDQKISDILKGLSNVEEIEIVGEVSADEIDRTREQILEGSSGSTRRSKAPVVQAASAKKSPPPQVSQQEIDELLGDDFEELGEELPSGSATHPQSATAPSRLDEDDDLVEIESGPS